MIEFVKVFKCNDSTIHVATNFHSYFIIYNRYNKKITFDCNIKNHITNKKYNTYNLNSVEFNNFMNLLSIGHRLMVEIFLYKYGT